MIQKPILLDETGQKMVEALNLIAVSQASQIGNVATWASVQQIVRQGLGPAAFPVGTQLVAQHDSLGALIWDVVGHDVYVNPKTGEGHSMALMLHDCIYGRAIDATEAFYYCESQLAAGTYNFTLLSGWDTDYGGGATLQFTLTKAVPAGGVLVFPWGYQQQATAAKVSSYESRQSTTALETVSVSTGTGGTNLGTLDGTTANVNHAHRARYGSNHWGESALRQWLNSDAAANAWWTPQTKFDRPASYANVAGFLNGMDADFLAAVGEVDVATAYNTIYNVNGAITGTYTTRDKFFLASRVELGLGAENSISEGSVFQLYSGAAQADRIKYDLSSPGTARYWWLRSPVPWNAYVVRYVHPDGSLGTSSAYSGSGAAPACVIY